MPLSLLIELFMHQAWADAELIRAVAAHPDVRSDERLIRLIHHIVVVQRVFTAMLNSTMLDMTKEQQREASVNALPQLSTASNVQLLSFVNGLTVERVQDPLENPRMPDLRSTVGETLMHVVLHSQNHRGQCLMRLRELTGEAPTLDFIWWVKLGRPSIGGL